jgi:hypothetical protein
MVDPGVRTSLAARHALNIDRALEATPGNSLKVSFVKALHRSS